ncbi:1270_t:CDS:2, partial [Ambispora gerdemannii]
AENVKLRQAIEENTKRDARVKELDQKNIELETRLAILEQGGKEKVIYTKDVSQSLVNFNDTPDAIASSLCESSDISDITSNSDDIDLQTENAPASDITDNTSDSDVAPERIENSSDSNPYQEKDSQSSTSLISTEDKRIKEKKLRGQDLSSVESEKTVNKIHDQSLYESSTLSKPSINSDSTDPFECNDDLSQPNKNKSYLPLQPPEKI